jgi:hypothetical protein
MKESAVERKLIRRVKALGGMCLKLSPTTAGMPDRLILMPGGRVALVEVKADKGKLSPIQVQWHHKANEIGHYVNTIYGSAGVDELIERIS